MPSMMDHVADAARGGVDLARLAREYDLPDFVKTAGFELNFRPDTPVNTYADPVNKQFPCHTKASCWLAHLFYQDKRAEFHPKTRRLIEERLAAYADHWGIKAAVAQIAARKADLVKAAGGDDLPDSSYAYVWAGENGTKERRLPLRSAMEVKAAAEYVREHRDAFPFAVRHKMARRILEKAAAFGASLGDDVEFLERQAGRGVPDPAKVVDMIEKRAMLVPADMGVVVDDEHRRTPGLRDHFKKMAAMVRDTPRKALQPDMLVKLAETVDQLDRNLQLVGKYSAGFPRPEDVIFEATFQKAAADVAAHVATTTGALYEKATFGKLAAADLRDLFGEDFVSRVTTPLGAVDPEKMAEEVATLPRPDAQLLDHLLSDNGIAPVMRKAAAAGQGFTREQMAEIAAAYG